jgi:hypothetical protein
MPSNTPMNAATTSQRIVAKVVDFLARTRQAKVQSEQGMTISLHG